MDSGLQQRYLEVTSRVAEATLAAGRNPAEVTTIVVTKFHPASLVLDLLQLGATNFGENKDQEAAPKVLEVRQASQQPHQWHFVGQLQSNKVKSVLGYACAIHSLDRPSLLSAIAKEQAKRQDQPGFKPVDVFIELNLTQDPERGGIRVANLDEFAQSVLEQPHLNLLGVMGVASLEKQPDADFALIQGASEQLQKLAPNARFISAGMSQDFEIALKYGATHLRIGTAITGPRQYN